MFYRAFPQFKNAITQQLKRKHVHCLLRYFQSTVISLSLELNTQMSFEQLNASNLTDTVYSQGIA